jgi:serine/threonine protein kinase
MIHNNENKIPINDINISSSQMEYEEINSKNERNDIMLGEYKLGKILGEGTFGKVRVGIHKKTQEKVI